MNEPISSKMSENPYIDLINYKEFLGLIAERLESIKGVVGVGAIHEIINLQGLMFNQIKIIDKRKEDAKSREGEQ